MPNVTKNINGNKYEFRNTSWSTRNSWGHETTLYINDVEISRNKVRYLNRTWESYPFQSCMKGLVDKLIESQDNPDLLILLKEL
jgi:hypothetical protein